MALSYIENSYFGTNSEGNHRIVYSEWGNKDAPLIVCVHGLTGNGHDFDWIAPELASRGSRVIAVDMPGRGRSDFIKDPMDYNYKQYLSDITALFDHLDVTEPHSIDWIGVSMGGLLGMTLASMSNTPIRKLIINDIGPSMPQRDLNLISQYISQEYRFSSLVEMENFMRQTRGLTWGPISDLQWEQMAKNNARKLLDGTFTYAFDPEIAQVFSTAPIGDLDLWACWDAVKCPTLVLRGSESTIFPQSVAEEMLKRGPGSKSLMKLEIIDGCGHVPSLMEDSQIEIIGDWLSNS